MDKQGHKLWRWLQPALFGAGVAAAAALLERYWHFTWPEAVILLTVLVGWYVLNKKLDTIEKDADLSCRAVMNLVWPILRRIERRQRGHSVPEPPKEYGEPGEYDDRLYGEDEESEKG